MSSARDKRKQWRREQARKGCRCYYCGDGLTLEDSTVDHVIPLSKGGPERPWNWVISCRECNQAKADKLNEELAIEVATRRGCKSVFYAQQRRLRKTKARRGQGCAPYAQV